MSDGPRSFRVGIIIESKWPIERGIEYAKLAEENAYDTAWVNDYVFDRDPFSILSLMAVNTSRIGLGTAVVNPYLRHPVVIAASIGTVTTLAPGRTIILGLGSSTDAMLKPIAVSVRSPVETCRQTIEIVRLLIRGEPADYNGSRFKLDGARLSFLNPEKEVPLFLALATGRKMMNLCGEQADGAFLMEATENYYIEVMKTVREGQKLSKKWSRDESEFETVANQLISVGSNRMEAIENLKPTMAANLERKGPGVAMMGLDLKKAQEYAREPSAIPDEFVQRFAICGTVDDCLERIASLRKIGITQIAHRFPSQEQIKSVGTLLLPALKE